MQIDEYDYEYLTGAWDGPVGAAFNVVAEYCRGAGLGIYGKPTEKGQRAIERFEKEHVHYVEPVPVTQVAKEALDILKTHIL